MGVKLQVSKQELYPIGDYLVQVVNNGMSKKDPSKVKIQFQIAHGPHAGKPVSRNFNGVISPQSQLGELLIACGVNIAAVPVGQELNLDIINGVRVVAELTHFTTQNGEINSLAKFRRFEGQATPAAPVAFVPPAVSTATLQGSYAPPALPGATLNSVPPQQSVQPMPTPALGPKINF